jgi:hypothetical protein
MLLSYQRQDSALTLTDGLAVYHEAYPQLITPPANEPGLRDFLSAYDRFHIVFGLTTSIRDEAMADTWTFFGSDMSWREYAHYLKHPLVNNILAEIGYSTLLRQSTRGLNSIYHAWKHARRQTAKWPFWNNENDLTEPICDLRRAFGIEVVSLDDT